jgi:hypothetical protein
MCIYIQQHWLNEIKRNTEKEREREIGRENEQKRKSEREEKRETDRKKEICTYLCMYVYAISRFKFLWLAF